jgi:hypothetical protein
MEPTEPVPPAGSESSSESGTGRTR